MKKGERYVIKRKPNEQTIEDIIDGHLPSDLSKRLQEDIEYCEGKFNVGCAKFQSHGNGVGNFMDKYPFFDFICALIVENEYAKHAFTLSPSDPDYPDFMENIQQLKNGEFDTWLPKEEIDLMKEYAENILEMMSHELADE